MSVSQTKSKKDILNDLAKRHEPFREIIERFGLLVCRQAELRAELPTLDLVSTYDEGRFLDGEVLVSFVEAKTFAPLIAQAAASIWPVLGLALPAMSDTLTALEKRLISDPGWLNLGLSAVVHGDGNALEQAAAQSGVNPDFLLMALRMAYAPCIATQKNTLLALAPAQLWRKPYCPVCGSDPDMAYLNNTPEPTEFLTSKGGECWHHCPVCTHHWRFLRLVCPGCGNLDHDSLGRFCAPDAPHELIYTCEKCHHYLPCLDLLERYARVDFDLAALGLVHLDVVAQTRGYVPLSPVPWTLLGLATEQAS